MVVMAGAFILGQEKPSGKRTPLITVALYSWMGGDQRLLMVGISTFAQDIVPDLPAAVLSWKLTIVGKQV